MSTFLFQMFDMGIIGSLTLQEMTFVVSFVAKFDTSNDNVHQALKDFGDNCKVVTLSEFMMHAAKFPVLIKPALDLQNQLRKKIMGKFELKCSRYCLHVDIYV